MTGEQIGNFRIIGRIGEGGMGEVLRAMDTMLEEVKTQTEAARTKHAGLKKEEAELVARLVSVDENEILVDAELWWQGKVRATSHSSWKRWRPRPTADVPPGAHPITPERMSAGEQPDRGLAAS